MMKLLALSLTASIAVSSANEVVFRPYRISYDELAEKPLFESARVSFLTALQREGIVAVTGIPNLHKKDTLATLHECAVQSKTTQEHVYEDGTFRRTMATHTLPNGSGGDGGKGDPMRMLHGKTMACNSFERASDEFRKAVAEVTDVFSRRLASLLDHDGPLLSTKDGHDFNTIDSIVKGGEHLEHFHSYQKSDSSSSAVSSSSQDETIDFHLDQGLLLVFSPAMLVQDSNVLAGILAEGFHIQLQDGTEAVVHFDEKDDLVFMLGDGINQYVNPKLKEDEMMLRSTPHALSMPPLRNDKEARVWYGRMVLPPANALHPRAGNVETTFGELRALSTQGEHMDLACSSNMVARQLEKMACEADTIFCWEKCMSLAEANVSESICAEQGLNLTCTNDARQLYVSGHGQFYPGCIDIANAEEVYGNPVHPSNQTTDTSGAGGRPVASFYGGTIMSALIVTAMFTIVRFLV